MNKICAQCHVSFPDEDYCPKHGVRLMLPAGPQSNAAPAEKPVESRAAQDDAVSAKLDRFMKKVGARPAVDARVPDAVAKPQRAPAPAASELASPLPDALRKQGWQIAGSLRSSDAVNRWPVQQTSDGQRCGTGEFRRFHNGALTPVEVYRRLEARPASRMVRVLDHGTLDLVGSRADFELVAATPPGAAGLSQWLAKSTPSEVRALALLPALVAMLEHLAVDAVRPLLLEPDTLVRNSGGEVWLASAAMLESADAAPGFHPEFARSSLLPRDWSAPELTEELMSSRNAMVFSVGQVLAACVHGRPYTLAELRTGAVRFRGIADARLARIMMGCLWPCAAERWTLADLSRALSTRNVSDLPATPPWSSMMPGATTEAFDLGGASFWRLEDLLQAAIRPAVWREATSRINDILAWAEGTAWAGQALLLRDALVNGRGADWALIKLRRTVSPDSPATWRELDLSDDQAEASLVALAQRALQEDGRADATAMLNLFELDLRGAFVPGIRVH